MKLSTIQRTEIVENFSWFRYDWTILQEQEIQIDLGISQKRIRDET